MCGLLHFMPVLCYSIFEYQSNICGVSPTHLPRLEPAASAANCPSRRNYEAMCPDHLYGRR
jgi:hypothetical protein